VEPLSAATPAPRLRPYGAAAAALLVAAVVGLALGWLRPGWLDGLAERSTDWAWRQIAQPLEERRLVVVDIDERSLAEVGPWPWPRATQARLLNRLAEGGAGLQILDVVFADARPDDAALQRAIAAHQPVLAQVFALPGQGDQTRTGEPGGALPGLRCPAPFGAASGHVANDPALTRAATAAGAPIGHITPRLARDGVVRGQPAVLCHQDAAYPALALAALMKATGETGVQVQRGSGLFEAPWLLQGTQGRMPVVPLDAQGDLRVPWWGAPSSWVSLSAADVLAGRVPAGLLQNTWVLVGSSAFGLNDTVATPFAAGASGAQVHAQLITALVDGRLPFTPRAAPGLQFLAAAAGLGLLGLLVAPAPARLRRVLPRVGLPWLPVLGGVWALVLLGLHVSALAWAGWLISWIEPALAVIAGALAWAMVEHGLSRRDRDRLFSHLSSYLPAPVAAALAAQGPSSAVSARAGQVSVLFADIRNFSAYGEARPPEESMAVLHAFFSAASRIVEAEGGIIESFQGDAIMAVWQADDSSSASAGVQARRALQAAVQLQAAAQGLLPDPAPAGLEPLALGIGLESGPAMSGSLGVASRRTHMVMGRTVTIASRLVGMTADLGYPILVGEGLAAQVNASGLQSLGTFMLDGVRMPHHVYAYPLFAAPRLDTDPRAGLYRPAAQGQGFEPAGPATVITPYPPSTGSSLH
jgi:adenylate cyclase